MINLLPKQARVTVAHIYHLRIAVVAVAAVFFLSVVAVLLLTPSYFLLFAKSRVVTDQLATVSKGSAHPHDSLDAIVGDIRTKLALFPDIEDRFTFSETGIQNIAQKRTPGILIKDLRYERKADGTHLLSISGTASSRESLQKFVESLKADPKYTGVTLPLSNFIQGVNIPFDLTFTGVAQK